MGGMMAKYGSDKVAFFLIDGFSVLGDTTELSDDKEAVTERTDPLGVTDEEHSFVGLRRASLSQSGFYNDDAGRMNEALVSSNGAHRVTCYGVEGNTTGRRFVGIGGLMQVRYQRTATRGELHKASAEYQVSGQVDEGVILHPLGAETEDGDSESDSVDGGASSSDGGVGFLQVPELELGGHDDVTIRILDSADNTTFAELIAFTAVDDAPLAERKSVSGTVEQYLATDWEFGGSGSDPSITFMAGFARV